MAQGVRRFLDPLAHVAPIDDHVVLVTASVYFDRPERDQWLPQTHTYLRASSLMLGTLKRNDPDAAAKDQ
jgi:hypothetical protein